MRLELGTRKRRPAGSAILASGTASVRAALRERCGQTASLPNEYVQQGLNLNARVDRGEQHSSHLCDEKALVTAAQHGEKAAFDELWQPHARLLFLKTYRITRNREDAADALQTALLNAFVNIRRFDGRSRFSTWLTSIAMNSALLILRNRRSAREVSIDDSRDCEGQRQIKASCDPAHDPEARCTHRECRVLLAHAIHQLSPPMREALILQALEERPAKEAAEIMKITISAAKTRLFRAKLALKRSLKWKICSNGALHARSQKPAPNQSRSVRRSVNRESVVVLNRSGAGDYADFSPAREAHGDTWRHAPIKGDERWQRAYL